MCACIGKSVYDGLVLARKSATSDATRVRFSPRNSPKKAKLKSFLGAVGEHGRYFFSLGLKAIPKHLINIAFLGMGEGGECLALPSKGIFFRKHRFPINDRWS